MPAIHAPWILNRNGVFHMIYGPTPIRHAVSSDLSRWTPKGNLRGAPSGRDPHLFVWDDTFYLFVCGWNGVWDKTDIQGAYQHKTYVYQSDDPLKFEHEVAGLEAHAPEIFQDEAGDWFISSVEWPHRGVSIARLVWE